MVLVVSNWLAGAFRTSWDVGKFDILLFFCSHFTSGILVFPVSHFVQQRKFFVSLTHFKPLVYFCTPWKHQKTGGFVIFSRVIERIIGMKSTKISCFFKFSNSRKSHTNYWFVISAIAFQNSVNVFLYPFSFCVWRTVKESQCCPQWKYYLKSTTSSKLLLPQLADVEWYMWWVYCVTKANAISQNHLLRTKILERHEKERKRQCSNRFMNIEHVTFTPLVFSVSGKVCKDYSMFHKHMAQKIADKTG